MSASSNLNRGNYIAGIIIVGIIAALICFHGAVLYLTMAVICGLIILLTIGSRYDAKGLPADDWNKLRPGVTYKTLSAQNSTAMPLRKSVFVCHVHSTGEEEREHLLVQVVGDPPPTFFIRSGGRLVAVKDPNAPAAPSPSPNATL